MRTIVVVCVITVSAFIGPSAWASLVELDQHQENQGYIDQDGKYRGFFSGVGGSTMMAQTFTAAKTGYLDHIQIGNTSGASYDPSSPPVVEIRDVVAITNTGGVEYQPGSTVHGSFELSYPVPYDNWTGDIPFRAQNIFVNTGQMYSIVLRANVPPGESGSVSVGAIGTTIAPPPPPVLDIALFQWLYPDDTLPWLYPGGELWVRPWTDEDEYGNPIVFDTWQLLSSDLFDYPAYDMQFRTYVEAVPLPAGVLLGICAVSVAGWHLRRQRG